MAGERRIFGPNKYAAFHLLFARWLRHFGKEPEYRYVTLGGTELRDIQNVWFIDQKLTTRAMSYENMVDRAGLALKTAQLLAERGLNVDAVEGSLFDYQREGDDVPHIFFLDLEGTCAAADYHLRFAEMLGRGTLKEDDALFITSYLGRNVGWEKLFRAFDAEFRILGLSAPGDKQNWYRRAHPSFTLFRALTRANLQDEVKISCCGCVEYRDTSAMGVYGYALERGETAFLEFIRAAPHYRLSQGLG